eukprot:scaffold70215_cov65-Phaeocystis_antarctica.AAC.4
MLSHSGAECVAPAAARDVTDGEVGGGWVEHSLVRVRSYGLSTDLAQLAHGGATECDTVAQQQQPWRVRRVWWERGGAGHRKIDDEAMALVQRVLSSLERRPLLRPLLRALRLQAGRAVEGAVTTSASRAASAAYGLSVAGVGARRKLSRQPNCVLLGDSCRLAAAAACCTSRACVKPRLLCMRTTRSGHRRSSSSVAVSCASLSRSPLIHVTRRTSAGGARPSAGSSPVASMCGVRSAVVCSGQSSWKARSVRMARSSAVIMPVSRSASPPDVPRTSKTSARAVRPSCDQAAWAEEYAACHAVPQTPSTRCSSADGGSGSSSAGKGGGRGGGRGGGGDGGSGGGVCAAATCAAHLIGVRAAATAGGGSGLADVRLIT